MSVLCEQQPRLFTQVHHIAAHAADGLRVCLNRVRLVDRHDQAHACPGAQQVVVRLGQFGADRQLVFETQRDFARLVKAAIGLGERCAVHTGGHHRAQTRLAGGGAMQIARFARVSAIVVRATTQQHGAGGDPRPEPFQR